MGFRLQPVRLEFSSRPTGEEMESLWKQLNSYHRSINWWIGDAAVFGTTMFGDEAYQYIEETMSPDLITRCERVSRAFSPLERDPTLSWTHHQILSYVPKALARTGLRLASQNNWNTSQLRQYVKDLAS